MSARPAIGVAVIGAGWMGHLHARAYARLPHHAPDLARRPRLVAVADTVASAAEDAAARFGFERAVTDWREVLADPDVEAVSVTAPNVAHRELGVAVAEAGKHLWIEKPVGLGSADTRAVAAAVSRAGVRASVGFNYRQIPAVARARRLLAQGAIGRVTHARFRLLTDFAAHPQGALTWRFTREQGGTGVLNDLAVHGVDLAHHLVGDLVRVVADAERVVPTRPVSTVAGANQYVRGAADAARGEVENHDYVALLGRAFGDPGAIVTVEANRCAVGDQNDYGFEIHGERGLLRFDFRRPGDLVVSTGDTYVDQPVSRVAAAPGDGDFALFQPGAANPTSFDDTKVSEALAFLRAVESHRAGAADDPAPDDVAGARATLADAVAAAAVLDAAEESVRTRAWVTPDPVPVTASEHPMPG